MVSHFPLLLSLYPEKSGVLWWTYCACSCLRLKGAFIDALAIKRYVMKGGGHHSLT